MTTEVVRLPKDRDFRLSVDGLYFDGHLDTRKLLPAVAGISHCMKSYAYGSDKATPEYTGVRFYRPIIPEQSVTIQWKTK